MITALQWSVQSFEPQSNSLILGIGMSVLSFPDVVVFFYILIKGTLFEFKYLLMATLAYFGSSTSRNTWNYSKKQSKNLDDDNHNQTHQENEDFKTSDKLVDIYVCII